MEYCSLGASQLKVSKLCLGTMTFGAQTDQSESNRIISSAKDNGVKGFPTHILKVDGKKIEGAVGRTYDELVAKVKSITG